ncbi:uncharacterized protein LOC123880470 [Maniola jurtina]|uniref:uncharacterized protein LOC123880470 n=1 Tax=Maniola jurtina TaxID=191418 RepID=UPI001E6880A7|nr:uncharacterized protein LOC123880470 [Maniola jurtina]XP_045784564.1 uncharacterized protein LOC123880470 [Maniola jurtina]XP_045784565.1 uncharacterized protein LOC123880470 [Maniola jurtina]XP_045784566.1 uncharacterized protein LOC123880470 [Maniola jurtina]XP_045784567.1 uncharacterized protein LOC123880470 [Maniola jurtina]
MVGMRRALWWHLLLVLQAALAQRAVPTACDEDVCRCDSFTRLICHCTDTVKEITLRPEGSYRVPSTATAIIIENCERVIFLTETSRKLTQLRSVQLRNISNVIISERALAWSPFPTDNEMNPGLRIEITNSTVYEISSHAIQGRVNDILISDSHILSLRPFAFSSLTGVKNIELTNNIFHNVEIQAFKKFTTSNFVLRGGIAKILPSRFLSDVEVTNFFRIEGVTIDQLSSLTFLVSLPKRVLIENNIIDTLNADSFRITSRGPVTFRNNTVTTVGKGAFLGFTVDKDTIASMGRQELLIDNNTMTTVSPTSLSYNQSTLTLRIDGLNLNERCTCEFAEVWREMLSSQGGIINCWYDLEGHFVSIPTFIDSRCGAFKQTFWIFVVVGIVLVLLIAGIVIFFIVKRENEKKKKLQIVMPDGKTYRETEFHIVVERAELLTTNL